MIFLSGGVTSDMLFIGVGGVSIILGVPVFIAIYFTLRHSSFYLVKVKHRGIGANLIYGLGIIILTAFALTVIMGCFFLYMYLTV